MADVQDAPAGPVLGPKALVQRELFEESIRADLAPFVGWDRIDDVVDEIIRNPHFLALLSSAREEGRNEVLDELERLRDHYPADVFPADGTSREAIAGTALRVVLTANLKHWRRSS